MIDFDCLIWHVNTVREMYKETCNGKENVWKLLAWGTPCFNTVKSGLREKIGYWGKDKGKERMKKEWLQEEKVQVLYEKL